jgi:hypothetical protein
MSKKLTRLETTAGNVLAGYMRSKLDANTLQPAIFSDLYGQKVKQVRESTLRVVDLTKALQDLKKAGRFAGKTTGLKKAVLIQTLKDLNYDFDLIDRIPKTYAQVIKQQPRASKPSYADVLAGVVPRKRGRPRKNPV